MPRQDFHIEPSTPSLTQADYPKMMAGAPVLLQFVGTRLGDEQLLKDIDAIDAVLNGETKMSIIWTYAAWAGRPRGQIGRRHKTGP